MKLSNPMKTILPLVMVILFSFNTTTFAIVSGNKSTGTQIAPNVSIHGVNVSNLTEAEALKVLKAKFEPTLKTVSITYGYKSSVWKYKFSELGVTYNYKKALDSAMKIVREIPQPTPTTTPQPTDSTTDGAITTESAIQTSTEPAITIKHIDVKLEYTINQKRLNVILDNISKKISIKPTNAVFKANGKKFEIIPEINGIDIDKPSCIRKSIPAITAGVSVKLILPMKIVKARYTKDNLLDVHDKLAEFTTKFDQNYKNRATNIELAAKNITNLIVMPNEVLSADKAMGPREEEQGYLPAHVILGNKLVDGIAGGICQVSTTLYNAALYANLQIVERSNHSLPSSYVKLGRDATVNGGNKDLKIKNNTGYPIYIINKIENGHLTFTIYGKKVYPNRKVVLKTKILSREKAKVTYVKDPTLPKGKVVEDLPSSTAYTVETFREVYEKGKLLSVEKLGLDKYRLVNGVIRVGTKVQ